MARMVTPTFEVNGIPAELHIRQDNEVVYSNMPEPDPNWKYTDNQGHKHYWEDRKYPTLEWVVTGTYWCHDCRDEHEEGQYRCRICGEAIEPGTRAPDPNGTVIPGIIHTEITVFGEAGESFEKDVLGETHRFERVAVTYQDSDGRTEVLYVSTRDRIRDSVARARLYLASGPWDLRSNCGQERVTFRYSIGSTPSERRWLPPVWRSA